MTDTFKSIDDNNISGVTMIKVYGALSLFVMLIAVASGQDYLDGGYARSGNYGDVGQYFTDPIFSSTGSHYTSSDPAISEMQGSMDRYGDGVALGSAATTPATQRATTVGKTTTSAAAISVKGRWHLELSEGRSIDLDLFQLGERIFGRGSMDSGMTSQPVTASGLMSGSIMNLNVVSESGTVLYAISLDISRLYLSSPYTVFRAGGETGSGTVRALRIATSVTAKNYN